MQPTLVLFDVNETLSDLGPLRDAFTSVGLEPHEVDAWFAGILRDGFALTSVGGNPAFAELAAESLRVRLSGRPVTATADAVERVMSAFTSLPVHPDVVPGLRALADRGLRVATLSNGSASVADGLLERAGVSEAVERTLSVADAPAWKPHRSAYGFALETCGVPAERAVLVAVHPWDIDGASRAGLGTAWLNRSGAPYPSYFSAPDVEVNDLRELAGRWG